MFRLAKVLSKLHGCQYGSASTKFVIDKYLEVGLLQRISLENTLTACLYQ